MILLYDHPLSPYAQKVKVALDEKGIAYETRIPDGIGVGGVPDTFAEASPRLEVPALIDGDTCLFDSTIILEYIEDKWPEPALLPEGPVERAKQRASVASAQEAAQAVLAGMEQVAGAVEAGLFKREYRDHRLEWMIKSGGLEIVERGLAKGNIRFTPEPGQP
mgnify:CR=1 FL=1|tara:strand:- start:1458 stop:1946 length:489 start_codon:yes stop_codon:yes gene_type:complete